MKLNNVKIIIFVTAWLVFLPSLALAQTFPGFPMSFFGTAKLNNNNLPAGTKILAYSQDVLVGETIMPVDGIYGDSTSVGSKLVVKDFTGELVFKYLPAGSTAPLSGDSKAAYDGAFTAGTAILYNINFIKNEIIPATPPASSGGGGGGGSNSYVPFSNVSPTIKVSSSTKNNGMAAGTTTQVIVLGEEFADYSGIDNLYGVDKNIAEAASLAEAKTINDNNKYIAMDKASQAIYQKIIKNCSPAAIEKIKYLLAFFIQQGSQTTKRLGAGERAGVLNSYYAAYGTLPQSEADWQDAIKIANGRWPNKKSEPTELRAKKEFKKVFLREPNMSNPHDNAAVTIIAYGLRPANRNLASEQAAIKSFRYIFKHSPASAVDWDITRAIAYSGASR